MAVETAALGTDNLTPASSQHQGRCDGFYNRCAPRMAHAHRAAATTRPQRWLLKHTPSAARQPFRLSQLPSRCDGLCNVKTLLRLGEMVPVVTTKPRRWLCNEVQESCLVARCCVVTTRPRRWLCNLWPASGPPTSTYCRHHEAAAMAFATQQKTVCNASASYCRHYKAAMMAVETTRF